jgi:hypothetical protein
MKFMKDMTLGAFNVALYLTPDHQYCPIVSHPDGRKIRTHEGDEYGDISTKIFNTDEEALQEAFAMVDRGGMT